MIITRTVTSPPRVITINKGSKGDTGLTGPAGQDGTDGENGLNGVDGKTTFYGNNAPIDAFGSDGDFYYDTLNSFFYGPRTDGHWPSGISIIGPAGEQGDDGASGVDGKTVLNGIGAPDSGAGLDGDFYIDTSGWLIYGPKTDGAWTIVVSLIGPTGETGADGPQGEPGDATAAGNNDDIQYYEDGNLAADDNLQWNQPHGCLSLNQPVEQFVAALNLKNNENQYFIYEQDDIGVSGLDDASFSGPYTGSETLDVTFSATIDGLGDGDTVPDTFSWSELDGDGNPIGGEAGVAIDGSAYEMNEGISITFGTTQGHLLGDEWIFVISFAVQDIARWSSADDTQQGIIQADGCVSLGPDRAGNYLQLDMQSRGLALGIPTMSATDLANCKPRDGSLAYDNTNRNIMARISGGWHKVVVI